MLPWQCVLTAALKVLMDRHLREHVDSADFVLSRVAGADVANLQAAVGKLGHASVESDGLVVAPPLHSGRRVAVNRDRKKCCLWCSVHCMLADLRRTCGRYGRGERKLSIHLKSCFMGKVPHPFFCQSKVMQITFNGLL